MPDEVPALLGRLAAMRQDLFSAQLWSMPEHYCGSVTLSRTIFLDGLILTNKRMRKTIAESFADETATEILSPSPH
jgi:hypothetical protein